MKKNQKPNKLYVEDSETFLLHPCTPVWNTLRFSGGKIEFSDRTATVKGFTVKEFIESFDKLIFEDKDGQQTVYERKSALSHNGK